MGSESTHDLDLSDALREERAASELAMAMAQRKWRFERWFLWGACAVALACAGSAYFMGWKTRKDLKIARETSTRVAQMNRDCEVRLATKAPSYGTITGDNAGHFRVSKNGGEYGMLNEQLVQGR